MKTENKKTNFDVEKIIPEIEVPKIKVSEIEVSENGTEKDFNVLAYIKKNG